MDRDFKGVWIPKEIRLSEDINIMCKILLVEIDSLSKTDDGCYAGNNYFAKFLGISTTQVSKYISILKDKGYIKEISFDGRRRILKSCFEVKLKAEGLGDGDEIGSKVKSRDEDKLIHNNINNNIIEYNLANAKENQPQPQEYGNKDVNNLIRGLRGACEELGVAYDSDSDRNFAYNLLRKKDYEELCKKERQDKVEFAINILKASVGLGYYVVCSGPKLIYRNYADVYNKVLQKKNKNNIPKFDVLY